jgi:hypothetical protein
MTHGFIHNKFGHMYTCYIDSLSLGLAIDIYLLSYLTWNHAIHPFMESTSSWGLFLASIHFMEVASPPNHALKAHMCHLERDFAQFLMDRLPRRRIRGNVGAPFHMHGELILPFGLILMEIYTCGMATLILLFL